MTTIMLKFGQTILTQTSLPFCFSQFSFFRLKTPADLSNFDLNFVKVLPNPSICFLLVDFHIFQELIFEKIF